MGLDLSKSPTIKSPIRQVIDEPTNVSATQSTAPLKISLLYVLPSAPICGAVQRRRSQKYRWLPSFFNVSVSISTTESAVDAT